MNLTPREKDKLMIAVAAMVARGRLARGVKLNYPESIALITDFVLEGARDGRAVADLMADGAKVVAREQVMEGIAEMIHPCRVYRLAAAVGVAAKLRAPGAASALVAASAARACPRLADTSPTLTASTRPSNSTRTVSNPKFSLFICHQPAGESAVARPQSTSSPGLVPAGWIVAASPSE